MEAIVEFKNNDENFDMTEFYKDIMDIFVIENSIVLIENNEYRNEIILDKKEVKTIYCKFF